MHESGVAILLFVFCALLLGALLKTVLRNSKLPYTVVLLLVGIAVGGANRLEIFGGDTLISNIFKKPLQLKLCSQQRL